MRDSSGDQQSGLFRWTSSDPRFPISIACPRGDAVYRSGDPAYLSVDWGNQIINFAVTRLDLSEVATRHTPDQPLAQLVIDGVKDMLWYQKQSMGNRKNVSAEYRTVLNVGFYALKRYSWNMSTVGEGASKFKAPRLVFRNRQGDQGEWVFFGRRPDDVFSRHPSSYILWTVIRNPDRSHPEYATAFSAMLESWRWLS